MIPQNDFTFDSNLITPYNHFFTLNSLSRAEYNNIQATFGLKLSRTEHTKSNELHAREVTEGYDMNITFNKYF